MLRQVRARIIGDVIGVGFRAWMKIQAKQLGIHGWVRNVYDRPDVFGNAGGVEALLQAKENDLVKMIDKVKEGSPVSRVDHVDVIPEEVKEVFETFEIRT